MTLDREDIEAIANAVVRKIGLANSTTSTIHMVENLTLEERKKLSKTRMRQLKAQQ